jgi:hypothetical protein
VGGGLEAVAVMESKTAVDGAWWCFEIAAACSRNADYLRNVFVRMRAAQQLL